VKSSDRPSVIVVGVDYSDVSYGVLRNAFQTACGSPQTEVHLIHVQSALQAYPCCGSDPRPSAEEMLGRAQERLQAFARKELASFQDTQRRAEVRSLTLVAHVRRTAPAEEIAQLAGELRADLIVVGTHGWAGEVRVGSVEHAVVTLAPCPVLVVREKALPPRTASSRPPSMACLETTSD